MPRPLAAFAAAAFYPAAAAPVYSGMHAQGEVLRERVREEAGTLTQNTNAGDVTQGRQGRLLRRNATFEFFDTSSLSAHARASTVTPPALGGGTGSLCRRYAVLTNRLVDELCRDGQCSAADVGAGAARGGCV